MDEIVNCLSSTSAWGTVAWRWVAEAGSWWERSKSGSCYGPSGASVSMAGRVGTDPFGKQLLEALKVDQIDTGLVSIDQHEATGVAFIFLTPDGDNAIIVL